jgi:hypothetical protein
MPKDAVAGRTENLAFGRVRIGHGLGAVQVALGDLALFPGKPEKLLHVVQEFHELGRSFLWHDYPPSVLVRVGFLDPTL